MKNTYISKDYDRVMNNLGKVMLYIVGVGAVIVAASIIVS